MSCHLNSKHICSCIKSSPGGRGERRAGRRWALHAVIFRTLAEGLRDLREVFQVGYNLKEWREAERDGNSLMVKPEIKG